MGRIDELAKEYARFVRLPWERNLAGPQKVWFALYQPCAERRLRCRIDEFALATKQAGHGWGHLDLSIYFAEWMSAQEYRESYFESPEDLELALKDFQAFVADQVVAVLSGEQADEKTVVCLSGVASLFGLMRVSGLMERVAPAIRGRLLVLFPGVYDSGSYRLLDAHDGWNYLAVPIMISGDESR